MKTLSAYIRSRNYAAGLAFLLLLSSHLVAAGQEVSIIPRPVSLIRAEGEFTLKQDTVILTDRETQLVGELLTESLARSTGYHLRLKRDGKEATNTISLRIDPTLFNLGDEGYRLEISAERVIIRAPNTAGAFYAAQSLMQLFPPEIYAGSEQRRMKWTIPASQIEDVPRFKWRGALLDVGRHFMPKEFVLKFIDLLALHKMNVFHWHLTDDQGWRIEIKKYPKLTQIGSLRKESPIEGSDQKGFDGTPHGGFYTQREIREIVAYAKRRFVTIVPEIEMPGHASAAIASYPELGNTEQRIEVSTHWGVHKDIYNVNEGTVVFLQNVLEEVLGLFPGKFICIGGDEVPKDQWKASREAQARLKELGLNDEQELQSYFICRMDQFLTAHGRRLIGWDEILEGGLAPGAAVMSWHGLDGGVTAARAGHDVVMAAKAYTYFDFAQSKDPGVPFDERRYVPLEKVYSFEPIPSELSAEEAKRILGAQGQLWTEHIPNPARLEYMAFPRLVALAEVAWCPREKRDYANFLERLKTHERRLEILKVNFRRAENITTTSPTNP